MPSFDSTCILILCMLGNFASADFFSKSTFLKKCFRNIIRVSYGLDLDLDQGFVGPDMGTNHVPIQRGGGVRTPTEKSQKYRVS